MESIHLHRKCTPRRVIKRSSGSDKTSLTRTWCARSWLRQRTLEVSRILAITNYLFWINQIAHIRELVMQIGMNYLFLISISVCLLSPSMRMHVPRLWIIIISTFSTRLSFFCFFLGPLSFCNFQINFITIISLLLLMLLVLHCTSFWEFGLCACAGSGFCVHFFCNLHISDNGLPTERTSLKMREFELNDKVQRNRIMLLKTRTNCWLQSNKYLACLFPIRHRTPSVCTFR